MAWRITIGVLVSGCAFMAVALFMMYQQSTATASAVAELQSTLNQADPVDTPVRFQLRAVDGTPLAGREVYVWPRRIDDPPFALPSTSLLWNIPKSYSKQARVTLADAYELLVTDADGDIDLGRRPAGIYTVAVNLEPELLAGRWVDERTLGEMKRRDQPVTPSWIGFAQRTFQVESGRPASFVTLQLPELQRTTVRMHQPPEPERISGGGYSLWLAIRGGGDDMTLWLRGFEEVPTFVERAAQLDLPLPPRPTLHIGYYSHRPDDSQTMPVAMKADLTITTGESPEVHLVAPRRYKKE